MKTTPLLSFALLFLTATQPVRAQLSPEAKSWLAAQGKIHTWSAGLVQTRVLPSLLEPLKSPGRVWFEAPGRFHWELGQPPKTIAVSTSTNLLLFYPRLKRVEIISLGPDQKGPWRSALDLLEAGFPQGEAELLDSYSILSQSVSGHICQLKLQPRSDTVRAMMKQVEIDFDTKDHLLRGTELEFADGSTMRNDFTNIVLNPSLDPRLFNPPIPADDTVVHPQMHR